MRAVLYLPLTGHCRIEQLLIGIAPRGCAREPQHACADQSLDGIFYHLADGVRARLPWLLEGTDLKAGDPFGVAAREVDTVDSRLSPPGTIKVAEAIVPPFTSPIEGGAFAWIGTRRIPYEPASNRRQRIDVAYAATGRGEVFSWGATGFLESIDSPAGGLFVISIATGEKRRLTTPPKRPPRNNCAISELRRSWIR